MIKLENKNIFKLLNVIPISVKHIIEYHARSSDTILLTNCNQTYAIIDDLMRRDMN